MTQENVIVLRDVVKEYNSGGKVIKAVNGITLEISRGLVVAIVGPSVILFTNRTIKGYGLVVAIVGPSGSGKTTLLNLISALHKPTSGNVYIDGYDLSKCDENELTMIRRYKIGFVFQTFNLIPNLSAMENIMLPMEFAGIPSKQREARAKDLLRLVSMDHRASHKPGMLSGGEQQRVAIARALANDPPIILADEPTGNLDSQTGAQIINLLKKLAHDKNKTVVVATHSQEIQKVADVVYTIRDGKIRGSM